MKEHLFEFARRMKWIHDLIANFSAGHFNDKELHFIVLGIMHLSTQRVPFSRLNPSPPGCCRLAAPSLRSARETFFDDDAEQHRKEGEEDCP